MNHIYVSCNRNIIKLIFTIAFCIALIGLSGCTSKEEGVSAAEDPTVAGVENRFDSNADSLAGDPESMDFSFPNVENRQYNEAMVFLEARQYEKAEEAFLLAVDELSSQASPEAEIQLAVVENELGKMYLDLEKYRESYDYLMRAYIRFRDRYGEDAEQTLLAKTRICIYDLAVGNYDLAIATLQNIYEQTRSESGKAQTATLLGNAYMNRSDYEIAESWYQKAITIGTTLDGYDLSDLYNDYGVLCMYESDWEKALDYLYKAKEEARDKRENYVSQIMLNIAQAYTKMGDEASAGEAINELIVHDSLRYGVESPYMAYDYMAVARLYQMMNDWEDQLRCLNTAKDILMKTEGENSHSMSVLYGDLSAYYYHMLDYQQAITYVKKAIEIKKNILEEKSDGMRLAYANLGMFLLQEQDGKTALEAYQNEYEIAMYLYGENSFCTGEAMMDLASACLEIGDLDTAARYAETGLAMLQENAKNTNTALGTAWDILGKIYAAKGQRDQAKAAWYKALSIFEDVAPREPINFAIDCQLGDLCLKAGEYSEAIENYLRSVEHFRTIYRYQSESLLYANNLSELYISIGFCAYQSGDCNDAIRYYVLGEELLNRYLEQNQISDNDDSKLLYRKLAIIYNNIAAAYENMGQTEDAVDYVLRSYRIVTEKEFDEEDFQKLLQRMERLNVTAEPAADASDAKDSDSHKDHKTSPGTVVIETEIPDQERIEEILAKYLEAIANADGEQLVDIMAMDYTTAAAIYLGDQYHKTVSVDKLIGLYVDFYQKELKALKSSLTNVYGTEFAIACRVTGKMTATRADIDAVNQSLQKRHGDNAPVIQGFLLLNTQFTINDREISKSIQSGFLGNSLALLKFNGNWELGTSEDFPAPGTELLLSVLQD